MNAKPFVLAAALCGAASSSSSAHADTHVGVGAHTTLRNLDGSVTASLATDDLVVELGLSHVRWDDASAEQTSTTYSAAVLPVLARRGTVALEAGLRATLMRYTADAGGSPATGRVFDLEAPIRFDVAVAPWLSLYAESSIVLVESQPGQTGAPIWLLAGGSNLAGFTVWF